MKNLYSFTRKENIFLAKKRWPDSIYCGLKMENRNITFPQTQTILSGINVASIALDDIQAVLNLRDAWQYLLTQLDEQLDIDFLCALQERIAYREALEWGKLRNGAIGISGVAYAPPIPNEKKAAAHLKKLLAKKSSATEIALDVFAWIARSQLFWDGNKRTAMLAANKILIEAGAGVLIIPDDCMEEFGMLLSNYYETGASTELKGFLYTSSIFGLDTAPQHKAAPPMNRKMSGKSRSATWLKQKRAEHAYTQKSLAEAAGVATSTISNIEQGQRNGSKEVWEKLEGLLS